MKKSRAARTESVLVFLLIFLVTNIGMAFYWGGSTEGVVYHCFDGGFGYLTPGSWVHEEWVYVEDLEEERVSADAMLVGWTIGRLWRRWLVMFAVTIFVSGVFTYLIRTGKAR